MTIEDYLNKLGVPSGGERPCRDCNIMHPTFALAYRGNLHGVCGACLADADRPESVEPGQSNPEWVDVRALRDILMLKTDWTQLPDVPADTAALYTALRQQLRDVTNEHPDPRAAMEWLGSVENFRPQ